MSPRVYSFFFLLGKKDRLSKEGPVGIDEAPGPNPTTSISSENRPGSTGCNRVSTCSRFFITASVLARVAGGLSTRGPLRYRLLLSSSTALITTSTQVV